MKKFYFLSLLLMCITAHAQNYSFSVHNEAYQDLNAPISLNNGEVWQNPDFVVPVGFDFSMGGNLIENLYSLGTNGLLISTESLEESWSIFIPVGQALADRGVDSSLSPISYQVDGTPGQQILKIEWNNAGFLLDDSYNDFINFQIWLYETSNIVEYHYGANSIVNMDSFDGETGIITALTPSVMPMTEQFIEPGFSLKGDPLDPTVEIIDENIHTTGTLIGAIPNGTVYRFTPDSTTATANYEKLNFTLYPNPANDFIAITETNSANFQAEIFNSLGQKLKSYNLVEEQQLNVSDLAPGIYIVEVTAQKAKGTSKFMKL